MAKKYVHKLNGIEAIRFDGKYSEFDNIQDFCKPNKVEARYINAHGINGLLIDDMLTVNIGDYIVKTKDGLKIFEEEEFKREYLPKDKIGKISDGYHTFDELYYHRMILFSIICNTYKGKSWKSWKHSDGTMYDDYFIVGITTDEGDYTYHYHKDYWDMFDVPNYDFANKWDGHEPKDITRLLALMK